MASVSRHSLAQLDGSSVQLVAGLMASGGTSTLLSPPLATASDIVTAKSSTGVYTITLNPFKGPLGYVNVQLTLHGNSGIIEETTSVYTNESLVVTVSTFAVDGTSATDKAFYFTIWAF